MSYRKRNSQQSPGPRRHSTRRRAGAAACRRAARARAAAATKDAAGVEASRKHTRADALAVEIDDRRVALTHLNKIYFPEAGYTKKDLLLYYARIAPYILPFLAGRPMDLRRNPNGIHGKAFFQKEAPSPRPAWLRTATVFSEERNARMHYLLADDLAALLYLTNLGCIDHNPWSSRAGDELHPDYLFFDLDPTPGTPFSVVAEVAAAIDRRLRAAGVAPFLKTSGATGFHLYVPLEPVYTYEQARTFAEALARAW